MSVRSLWRRKLRTSLTVLGVVIGASSIILMLSLGIAMNSNFREQIESMRSLTVIDVWANNWEDPNAPKLDDKAVEELSRLPGVQRVLPEEVMQANLEFGRYRTSWPVRLQAMDPEDIDAFGYRADIGRAMAQGERQVIMIGKGLLREFNRIGKKPDWRFPSDPIEITPGQDSLVITVGEFDWESGKPTTDREGRKVKIPKTTKVEVVGMFNEESYQSYSAFIPRALFEKISEEQRKYREKLYGKQDDNGRYKDPNKYQSIKVKVVDEKQVVDVQKQINDLGYRAHSAMEQLEEMKKVANSIQIILGGIGGISLFVAAIGITNTMMMSTYERTKEIGVMKVIGAKLSDIKKLFLMEALMIGAIGGMVGVGFSYSISYLLNRFGGQFVQNMMMGSGSRISQIPPWLALSALIFSACIGLISGYFPARRAMKLSALGAIRTE